MTIRSTRSSTRTASGFSLLDATQARAEQASHRQRVERLTRDHLSRRARGQRHPVWDFMFDYYPITPGKLAHWHPGALRGIVLAAGDDSQPSWLPTFKNLYRWHDALPVETWMLDVDAFWGARGSTIRYVHDLLTRTLHHTPQLGCFGLHEWAMVYRDSPRHPEPLRLGAEETNAVVEQSHLKCTHYDAFRFFTPAAAPRNQLTPTRDTQPMLEQPGCLHATMDVYKWATKLGPLVPGDLWLDTFELACDVRQLDMEASPYDLTAWGFEPVTIETPQGRAEYVRRQQQLMDRGQALRTQLIALLRATYPVLSESQPDD
ncbi:3-methyladenine DNA glycosylase [Corynebacterium auriscanis]|uniref:3-methyladenine DNA glycosylase n=1 Tax=Corynebacterium auriscanis TaxID=99807 RepID=UPI003CE88303